MSSSSAPVGRAFARRSGRRRQRSTLSNVNVLDYVRTGRDVPGGWIWQKLARSEPG